MGSARRASVLEVRALVADAADRRIQHLEVVWYPNDHLLGGIAGISKSLYEAADIDGASWRRKTWSITLPLLKPQIIFVMTMNIINGMQMFIEVLMNFDLHGGPYNAALTPVLYLYKTGFSDMKMGTASTIGLLLAAVIYIFTMLQLKFTQERSTANAHQQKSVDL